MCARVDTLKNENEFEMFVGQISPTKMNGRFSYLCKKKNITNGTKFSVSFCVTKSALLYFVPRVINPDPPPPSYINVIKMVSNDKYKSFPDRYSCWGRERERVCRKIFVYPPRLYLDDRCFVVVTGFE